jgi:mono/diheme cytochrome c family protein
MRFRAGRSRPTGVSTISACRALAVVAACALAIAASAPPSAAQLPSFGLGRAPTVEEIRAWDVTIPPDGKGLPPGRGTAALGKEVYADRCASCHAPNGNDGKYDPLVGGRGTLTTDKPVKTVGSYRPYATTLWSYINRSQPFDEPGSLTHDQVYAVTAYLLYLNGIIKEDDVIDARTLPAVKMPNRDGFVPDPRPDVGRTAAPKKR